MQLVQTYLGSAPDEGTFVYYISGTHQDEFTREIADHLFAIGRVFRQEVHLYGPDDTASDHISHEIADRFGDQLFDVMNLAPGFLVTRKPLAQFQPGRDEGKFISLGEEDALGTLEQLVKEQAAWQRSHAASATPQNSLWHRINSRFQFSINLGPISIGLR